MTASNRKKELDKKRTEWRKKHRTLNGRIILYPEKPPEHINARASKLYSWFWKKILLEINPQEIPAVISAVKKRIQSESDNKTIQTFRTMIGMAEDAYQLKRLEDIKDYDTELFLDKNPVYNSEQGIIYKQGDIYTTDYTEEEDEILVRDIEGVIVDALSSESQSENESIKNIRNNSYKDWNYSEKL
ncbi:MAG: acetyltransferase [Thermoplasmatota archaeon]